MTHPCLYLLIRRIYGSYLCSQGDGRLIKTSREINDAESDWVVDQIKVAAAETANTAGSRPAIAALD